MKTCTVDMEFTAALNHRIVLFCVITKVCTVNYYWISCSDMNFML